MHSESKPETAPPPPPPHLIIQSHNVSFRLVTNAWRKFATFIIKLNDSLVIWLTGDLRLWSWWRILILHENINSTKSYNSKCACITKHPLEYDKIYKQNWEISRACMLHYIPINPNVCKSKGREELVWMSRLRSIDQSSELKVSNEMCISKDTYYHYLLLFYINKLLKLTNKRENQRLYATTLKNLINYFASKAKQIQKIKLKNKKIKHKQNEETLARKIVKTKACINEGSKTSIHDYIKVLLSKCHSWIMYERHFQRSFCFNKITLDNIPYHKIT